MPILVGLNLTSRTLPEKRRSYRVEHWVLSAALLMIALPVLAIETDPGNPDPGNCLYDISARVLSATPAAVMPGSNTLLTWELYPHNCSGVTLWFAGERAYGSSGSVQRTPLETTTYTLTATRVGTQRTLGSITVESQYPLPSGPRVDIYGSSTAHRNLLKRALEAGGKTIVLAPDVDMDLTGMEFLVVGGTTLTSNGARSPHMLGPRLYVRTGSAPVNSSPLLYVRCGGEFPVGEVKIEGFRLQGPHWNPVAGEENREKGIQIDSCKGVSISNMEISGWSGQGVFVTDSHGLINQPEDVKVFNNFFHHNQHKDGYGYGVQSAQGARVLIERNVFDFNRHALMASSGYEPGAEYIARHNVVLKGGGYHESDTWPHPSWQTHQFDVHGTTSCGPWFFDAEASCGEAGIYFEFTDNAFQYSSGEAIKIRGNPLLSPLASRNVFAQGSQGSAIKQNGWDYESAITSPIITQANRYGFDSFARYGVCDFNGDGTDDLFLATGANWWWSSGGKMHWTFLRAATETLDQVGLGDFDGDGKCDVVAGGTPIPLQIAKGGYQDWRVLVDRTGAALDLPFSQIRFHDFNGDGRTDIFHRDTDGQWRIISPGVVGALGVYDWTPIASSGIALSELRFGHFNNDRITDVIAVQGGKWSVSWGGNSSWSQLNRVRNESLQKLLIADINNNGIDDIMRYRWLRNQSPIPGGVPGGDMGIWEVTWDGRGTNWIRLNTYTAPTYQMAPTSVPAFVGRFDGVRNASRLLTIPNSDRMGMVYDPTSGQFKGHSLYAY